MRIAPRQFRIRIAVTKAAVLLSPDAALIDDTGAIIIDETGFSLVVV